MTALALAGCNLGVPPEVVVSFPGESVLDLIEADVDVDGDRDVVARFSNGTTVALGDGAGGFTVLPRTSAIVRGIGDVSGDGRPDALVTLGQGALGYRLGDGTGRFSTTTRLLPAWPYAIDQVEVADLDGDGDGDVLAAAGGARYVGVWLNGGGGSFGQPSAVPGLAGFVVEDLDGDDVPDLVAPVVPFLGDGDGFTVSLGDGAGDFAAPTAYPVVAGGFPVLAVGDLDGDGDPDVATGQPSGTNDLVTFLNDGAGAFGPGIVTDRPAPADPEEPGRTTALAIDDIDGDGVADLATHGDPSSVLFGVGDGTFEDAHDILGGDPTEGHVLTEDVDGDGRVDLVQADALSGEVRLFRNALDGRTH